MKRVLVFAGVFAVVALTGVRGPGGPAPAVAMTRLAQNPSCAAACLATFNAEEQRCRTMDLAGGWRGAVYTPCVGYARHVYNGCVAACPA
jgi:hypothetical protein